MTPAAALRQSMSFRCTRAPMVALTISSLRRPELRVRRTRYAGMVVDERVLTRGFPSVDSQDRVEVLVVLSGSIALHLPEPVVLAPGEAWLIPRSTLSTARFEDAEFFEIDWIGDAPVPRRLAESAQALVLAADELTSVPLDGEAQRAYLTKVIARARALGAAIPDAITALEGGPTERDLRLADALTEQLANLRREGTAPHLGEDAALSARQLQRVVEDFNLRYGLNATSWRDTRSRWRIQIAVVLLSVPSLSIAEVADEVGFSGATALARAFARWKLDPPSVVRERLLASRAASVERATTR